MEENNNEPGSISTSPESAEEASKESQNFEDKPEREMHKATCSDCGNECEVPFKPTEGRDVRCMDCFKKNRPQRNFGNGGRPQRRNYDVTCAECGKDCTVPFKPSGGKPVLCRDCYSKK